MKTSLIPPTTVLAAATLALCWREPELAVQVAIFVVVTCLLGRSKQFQSVIRSLPSTFAFGWLALVTLMFVGQLTASPYRTFPFVAWAMYGRPVTEGSVEWFTIRGIDDFGNAVDIDPLRLYPSLGRGTNRIVGKIHATVLAMRRSDNATAVTMMRELLMAIGETHERSHGIKLSEVQLLRHAMRLSAKDQSTEVFFRVESELP